MNWYLQSSENSDVAKSTRVRLARNLNDFKFKRRFKKINWKSGVKTKTTEFKSVVFIFYNYIFSSFLLYAYYAFLTKSWHTVASKI